MAVVGINGFGKIGRMCLRACLDKRIEVRLINDPFLSTEHMAYLFKYDSTHGPYPLPVSCDETCIVIDKIRIATSREKKPCDIKWSIYEVKYVIEASGTLTAPWLEQHISAGAKNVIITAPEERMPILLFGVNHTSYNPKEHRIVSAACSTANCIAPIIKVMHDNFKVLEAMITNIRTVTTSQNTVDGTLYKCTTLWRNSRGALQNIIPIKTGATKSLVQIFPEFVDKISTIAFMVPIPDVSLCDMIFRIEKPATYEDIKKEMKEAANGYMRDVLGYTEDNCASSDFSCTTYSCVFDANVSTANEQNSTSIRIVTWHDNVTGYSYRIADLIQYIYSVDP